MTVDSNMTTAWQPLSEEEAAAIREKDWKELHWRLRSIAQQRLALEAKETSLLLEAEESRLYRRLGYSTMIEYMERELHWGTHAANERLRVARALLALPLIADTFERGELCFSAVRELTRVATSENEHEFLTKAQGRTARDVERMVAGLRRGDSPEDDPDPKLIKKKIMLEVSAEVWARYRRTRTEREKAYGQRLDDSELLDGLLRDAEAPAAGQVAKPAVQVAVTICKSCKKSSMAAGGQQSPIDNVTSDWLTCDAELIGDLESNDLTRPKSHIPDAQRLCSRDHLCCQLLVGIWIGYRNRMNRYFAHVPTIADDTSVLGAGASAHEHHDGPHTPHLVRASTLRHFGASTNDVAGARSITKVRPSTRSPTTSLTAGTAS
jgi:hypothetical protein